MLKAAFPGSQSSTLGPRHEDILRLVSVSPALTICSLQGVADCLTCSALDIGELELCGPIQAI